MRVSIVLFSLLSVGGCGQSAEEAPPPTTANAPTTATAELAAEVRAPQHGGTVIVTGDKAVEVVAKADGTVDAYVRANPGAPPPAADATMTVNVRGQDGQTRTVTMRRDDAAAQGRGQAGFQAFFTGRIEGTAPAPGPVEVVFVSSGTELRGSAPTVTVVGQAAATAEVALPAAHGGVVVAVENQPVEVLAKADGEVEAFFVADASGGFAIQPADATVIVHVMGANQQPHPVTLTWDATTSSFRGRAGASVQIVPGPVEVAVTAQGRARRARTQVVALVDTNSRVGADVHGRIQSADAPGQVRVRGRRGQTVEVGGGGGVVVQGSGGGRVEVGAPAARAGVRVQANAPPPPSARVNIQVNAPAPPPPPRVRASGSVGVSAGGGVRLGN